MSAIGQYWQIISANRHIGWTLTKYRIHITSIGWASSETFSMLAAILYRDSMQLFKVKASSSVIKSSVSLKNLTSAAAWFPQSLASVVFSTQSQSGIAQWSPSSGCHLAGCAPIKELIRGVNLAAAGWWGREVRAEPGSQTRPRPGGIAAPHPSL